MSLFPNKIVDSRLPTYEDVIKNDTEDEEPPPFHTIFHEHEFCSSSNTSYSNSNDYSDLFYFGEIINALNTVTEIKLTRIPDSTKFEIWNTNGSILFSGDFKQNEIEISGLEEVPGRKQRKKVIGLYTSSSFGHNKFLQISFSSSNKWCNFWKYFFARKKLNRQSKVFTSHGLLLGSISYKMNLWTKITFEMNGISFDDGREGEEERYETRLHNLKQGRFEIKKISNDLLSEDELCASSILKRNCILMRFVNNPGNKLILIAFLISLEILREELKVTRKIFEFLIVVSSLIVVALLISILFFFVGQF